MPKKMSKMVPEPVNLWSLKSTYDQKTLEKKERDARFQGEVSTEAYLSLLNDPVNLKKIEEMAKNGANHCWLPRYITYQRYQNNERDNCFNNLTTQQHLGKQVCGEGYISEWSPNFNPGKIDFQRVNQVLKKHFGPECRIPLEFSGWVLPSGYRSTQITWEPMTLKERFWHTLGW